MKLTYGVKDKPKFGQLIVFALQQLLAILAATIAVPSIVGNGMSQSAALFGAGVGTIVYLLFTGFKSPVFLGSSFTFLGALCTAATQNYGYWGLIIGVAFAGLVYAVIALIIKLVGSGWIKKLLPHVIIGPVLAIIGLSLSGTAGSWMMYNGGSEYGLWYILVGLVTFVAIVIASTKGGKSIRLIPFIVGIGAGLVFAILLTCIGLATNYKAMQIVDFTPIKECFAPLRFQSFFDYPKFTFLEAGQNRRTQRRGDRKPCDSLRSYRGCGTCSAYLRPRKPFQHR